MMHVRWSIASSLIALLLIANVACGEIPKLSREELLSDASAAFTGKVVETYARVRKSETYEETSGVAEIAVERIEKGSDIAVGDRAFVRYWHKRWIGQGPSPPDHYGHWNIPSQGDVVSIFVRGDRKKGFDVLSPNGFFEVKKAAKEKSGKPK